MKRFIVLLCLMVPFAALALVMRTMVVEPDSGPDFTVVPDQVGTWRGEEVPIGEATAAVLQASNTLLRNYLHPDSGYISLFIAYFRDQKYGSQIHSPRHCLPGGGWVVSDLKHVPFDLGESQITCNRMTITKRATVDEMFYWYQTRSGVLASEYSLKFDLVRNSLLFSPTDAALIRVTVARGNRTAEECQRIAEAFMQSCIREIDVALPFEDHGNGIEISSHAAAPEPVD